MSNLKLSAAIATYNEATNIGDCLKSIKDIVDEIIIVDGSSTDETVSIAKKYGAKVEVIDNQALFHINKQRSFELAKGEWILYLDADERVSPALAKEIVKVINLSQVEQADYQNKLSGRQLFQRHQQLLEKRDGQVGYSTGDYNAFFFPRLNFFLGKYLRYGGVYPDGVIRLFKNGQAFLPCKNIHEQLVVKGQVGWLESPLWHYDSPTFSRYISRNSRYIDLIVTDLKTEHLTKNFVNSFDYLIVKPLSWFLMTLIRHKGLLDGYQGIVFSFFSALRFPRAYLKYLQQ